MISVQALLLPNAMSIEQLIPFLARSMKAHREKLGLSLNDLSQRTGYSAEYIEFIETGGTNFAMKTLKTIAEAMDTAPSQLIKAAEELADSEAKKPH